MEFIPDWNIRKKMSEQEFDPFNEDLLPIMTQREAHEDMLPLEKFWSQEPCATQSTTIPNQESDKESEGEELYSSEEGDIELEENAYHSTEEVQHMFSQSSEEFLLNYNNAVNSSVEDHVTTAREYSIDGERFDDLTKRCSSPLFECIVASECNLDDLKAGSKLKNRMTQAEQP